MKVERVRRVADYLRNHVTDERFRMSAFCSPIDESVMESDQPEIWNPATGLIGEDCQTYGCIAGWTIALFPAEAKASGEAAKSKQAAKVLGFTERQRTGIFFANDLPKSYETTRLEACDYLDKLAEKAA